MVSHKLIHLFFDVDNCLYPASFGMGALMEKRIIQYCVEILYLPLEEASDLAFRYFKDYGLAIRGLLKHHLSINPNEYDQYVDGGLPVESLLSPDPQLRSILQHLKQVENLHIWAFSNAGKRHVLRVLQCLDIQDCFEGFVCTDYSHPDFSCKPEERAFQRAIQKTLKRYPDMGLPREYILVDDSRWNVEAALQFGWKAVLVHEKMNLTEQQTSYPVIKTVHDILSAFDSNHFV